MVIYYRALCAMFVIAETYILSKQLFEQSFQKQINLKFRELPWYLRLALRIFGDKKKYEYRELWMTDMFPVRGSFTRRQKLKIIEPFIGFILICLGTMLALLF